MPENDRRPSDLEAALTAAEAAAEMARRKTDPACSEGLGDLTAHRTKLGPVGRELADLTEKLKAQGPRLGDRVVREGDVFFTARQGCDPHSSEAYRVTREQLEAAGEELKPAPCLDLHGLDSLRVVNELLGLGLGPTVKGTELKGRKPDEDEPGTFKFYLDAADCSELAEAFYILASELKP